MKTLIEQRIAELKQHRAQLDGEIKRAEQFLHHAVPEITGVQAAITELEKLLKAGDEHEALKNVKPT